MQAFAKVTQKPCGCYTNPKRKRGNLCPFIIRPRWRFGLVWSQVGHVHLIEAQENLAPAIVALDPLDRFQELVNGVGGRNLGCQHTLDDKAR